jgi:hypothetical protein
MTKEKWKMQIQTSMCIRGNIYKHPGEIITLECILKFNIIVKKRSISFTYLRNYVLFGATISSLSRSQ